MKFKKGWLRKHGATPAVELRNTAMGGHYFILVTRCCELAPHAQFPRQALENINELN
jgi:hypothetical protein